MTPKNEPEFARIVTGLAAIKPGKALTPEGIALFWGAMQDWTIEEFRSAAAHLARSVEFMPNPYHFEQLRRASKPTAGESWAKAIAHAASSAYRAGPLWDPIIDSCVEALGGYVAIAMTDTDKLHFLERRFCEHFEAKSDVDVARAALPNVTDRRSVSGPKKAAYSLASEGSPESLDTNAQHH